MSTATTTPALALLTTAPPDDAIAAAAPIPVPVAETPAPPAPDVVRNALRLGASLLFTWGVALAVRMALPRALGPSAYGVFQFVDAYTTTLFVLTSLGVELYVRKEITERPAHVRDFFGGVLLLRVVLGVGLLAFGLWSLPRSGMAGTTTALIVLLALTQLLLMVNNTNAALLQAIERIDGLSVLNVASKVLWGVATAAALVGGYGVTGVAAALLLSEVVRTLVLGVLLGRHFPLSFRVHPRATWLVLAASVPFFLTQLAQTAYARVGTNILAFLAPAVEVGWYAAASNLAGMALLMTPLIGWVLLPITGRALAESEEAFRRVTIQAMRLIIAFALPCTLGLALGADPVVQLLFGREFEPAALTLKVLAPMYVMTYISIVSSCTLVRLDRGWTVTAVTVAALLVAPVATYLFVSVGRTNLGAGGAGVGAAAALLVTEALVTVALTSMVARYTFDRASLAVAARLVGATLLTVALHEAAAPLGLWRLPLALVAYTCLAILCGAVHRDEAREVLRRIRERRSSRHASDS